jgi:hypothetical protein
MITKINASELRGPGEEADVRRQAAEIFVSMRFAATAAILVVGALLKDDPRPDVPVEAMRALRQIDPLAAQKALPAVSAALSDKDACVRLTAVLVELLKAPRF